MGLPSAVAQIGGEEREAGFAHALQEHILAEVEFMVAGREDIGRRQVGERDGVFSLVEAGEQGRRDQVACVGVDHIAALGALGFHHGVEPGEAAARDVLSTL